MMDPKQFLIKLHENLAILQEREAKYAGNTPLELRNQIKDHQQAIALTGQVIAGDLDEAGWQAALQPLLLPFYQALSHSVMAALLQAASLTPEPPPLPVSRLRDILLAHLHQTSRGQVLADEFCREPTIYERPVQHELTLNLQSDAEFALRLHRLLAEVEAAQRAGEGRTQAILSGSGAIAQGAETKAAAATAPYATAVNEVGGDLTIIHHPPPPPDPTPANLRQCYLSCVYRSCRSMSLVGIDPKAAGDETAARLNLGAVYTALLTLSPEEQAIFSRGALGDKPRQSALARLNRDPYLVLLGDPGSGKTTFVNFVAMCLAGAGLPEADYTLEALAAPLPQEDGSDQDERQPWEQGMLLPVKVTLRDFAAGWLPAVGQPATAQHLWSFIEAELDQAALSDFKPLLKQALRDRKQGGLLLLDGLDEVPEANHRRDQLRQVVVSFRRAFPHCRILVTGRTYAYQRQDWKLPDFAEAVLAPFSAGQIRRFVERWYTHMALLRGQPVETARGRAELLKQVIFRNERLQELAERPLLLTLMSSLHAWRGGSLPEKRADLYADAVDLLLDTWESQKPHRDEHGHIIEWEQSLSEWLQVDRDEVRRLLNRLAYDVHAAQPDTMGAADIPQDMLIDRLQAISRNDLVTSAWLVQYLSRRAGLLSPHGVGVYTFPHRTFQEYLAACHLSEDNETFPAPIDDLARTEPERWREVALLAAARAGRAGIWNFVECLLGEGQPPKDDEPAAVADLWGARLAGQALVEVADVKNIHRAHRPKLLRLAAWLVYILDKAALPAIERAEVGQILAALGDPRPGVGLRASMRLPDILWCDIPAGPFLMGSDKETDSQAWDDETPQHTVELPGYKISRYPVTNAQFAAFVEAGGYHAKRAEYWPEAEAQGFWQPGQVQDVIYYLDDDRQLQKERRGWRDRPVDFGTPFNLPNHPVVGVSWYEALAFCRWLQEKLAGNDQLSELQVQLAALNAARLITGVQVTLPGEAEWEKAARGETGQRYPWGNEPDSNRANYEDTKIGATNAVGCFPKGGGASPYGVEEMSGNVWEWTRSLWGRDLYKPDFNYPYDSADGREDLEAGTDVPRVLRGGSFFGNGRDVRCASRYWYYPNLRFRLNGFRVCLSPLF
ncbi:MAG: SUMF1/EgtB/PvdO family nonheme iron enzyme [Chloroflexota bacterium]